MIECSLIKSVSRCHYTEEDWLDRVYASSETPITPRSSWILCWLQPFKWSFPSFLRPSCWKPNYAQNRSIFFNVFSCKYEDTLASSIMFFSPHGLINNSSVFLIIRIKCWSCSIHYGFCLFVLLLFVFFHVHHKKSNFGNGFINNYNHDAVTLISSEWNE